MRSSILTLLVLSLICPIHGQEPATPEPALRVDPSEYRLGPGDLLEIKLLGFEPEINTVRISNSGKIHLPHMGVFPVAGLTTHELEVALTQRIIERKLLKEPQALVLIREFRAQPIYILGEVGMPGQYVLHEGVSLMDLITMAGGVNDYSRDYGFLYRRKANAVLPPEAPPGEAESEQLAPSDALYTVIKIDLKSLKEGERLDLNVPIQGGDLFYVPEKELGIYYVVGDVLRTGPFQVPDGEPLLVTRALAMAGGPTRTAKMSQGMLVRYDPNGERREMPVDFAAIFKGKRPDFVVQPDDIIFIPGSNFKTIGYGLLGILPQMAGSAAYAGRSGGERSSQNRE
jgi:polysaccharide biosynthesis/export protein